MKLNIEILKEVTGPGKPRTSQIGCFTLCWVAPKLRHPKERGFEPMRTTIHEGFKDMPVKQDGTGKWSFKLRRLAIQPPKNDWKGVATL